MADEIDLDANPENGFGDEPMPQVAIITQYVKDLSFENPNAPGSLQVQSQPRIDVNVGVNARKAADDVYEVELKISAKAEVDAGAAFMVELLYAGLFGLKNVPEEAIEPFCIIEGPRILFPVRPPHHRGCRSRRRLPAADARSDRFRRAVHVPAGPGRQRVSEHHNHSETGGPRVARFRLGHCRLALSGALPNPVAQ